MMENKTIAAALLVAQKAAEAVGKTSRNEFAKFNYASAESMIAECRGALHEAGLVLLGGDQEVCNKDGEAVLYADYHLIHESGESLKITRQLPICVGKGKPLDKAMLGAATETLGYLLRDLLLIPRQEADVSGRDDRKHEPRRPAPKAAPASQPAPKRSDRSADVERAKGWIADCTTPADFDACAALIKDLGLEGEDRHGVVSAYKGARNG